MALWLVRGGSHGNDLIEQLLINYDRLDQSIQAEIPLKRIWLVANQSD